MPILYNIYSEYMMRMVLRNWNKGVSIGGTKITNLRFANDTVLLAGNAQGMKEIINAEWHTTDKNTDLK